MAVLSWLPLRDVGACASVSHDMHALTKEPLLWSTLAARRWGDSVDQLSHGIANDDLVREWNAISDKQARYKLRHTHLGDWVFGRYALRSFGESTEDIGGGSGIAAMEYIEEDHVVILGYQAGYIEIWDMHTASCLATRYLMMPRNMSGGPIQKMLIRKYKVVTGFSNGVVVHAVVKDSRKPFALPYEIETTSYFCYASGYKAKETLPLFDETLAMSACSSAVACLHSNAKFLFLFNETINPETGEAAVTRILLGNNAANEVLFHLDAVEFRGQREVVRVVMFMKQTRNLHVFHMPDLLKPPVHRVVPLVGQVGMDPREVKVSGNVVALLGLTKTYVVNLDNAGFFQVIQSTLDYTSPSLTSAFEGGKLLEMTRNGLIVLHSTRRTELVLSVDDFYVPQPPAVPALVEPDLRLRTKYSMARFYKSRLLLLTEDGVVRLVDCAPSDAAMAHQIERFQQRLERAPKRVNPSGIGALIALEGAQVRDDCTLFLVDLLRKAKHRVDELEKSLQLASSNTNKEALAAARKSLNVIVSEAIETADRALGYINNQVTLNTVHILYSKLKALLEADQTITAMCNQVREIDAALPSAYEDDDDDDDDKEEEEAEEGHGGILRTVRQSNRIDEMWAAGERIIALSRAVNEKIAQASKAASSSSILEAQSCDLVETVGELEKRITAQLETALLDLIGDQARWSRQHPQHEWTDATAICAQSLGSILQRQLRNAQKHSSWLGRAHVEVALKQAEDNMRAELIAYQRKQLCLKIAYEPALLDSLEATHDKLVELKNYHNLQDTYRGLQQSDMAILEKVIQEVSTRLEQHVALRSIQCWQQITRDPAFSSPEQVTTLAESLLAAVNHCKDVLPSQQPSHIEQLIAAAREAEEWVFAVTEVPQSVYEVETNLQRAQELERQLTNNLHAYQEMPTWKRLAARKEALANSLAQARRHELEMIHQELEHIDEWLDQQRRQLDALLPGGQPVFDQPETETKAQTEAELQQSRERPVHDEAASAAVEQLIEATLGQIRAQIRHLTHHKARSTAWFKLEERGLKKMDDVVDRLKQAVIDVRTQTWITRIERAHEVVAALPLEDLLDQYERFTSIRCRADEPHWLAGDLRCRLDDFANGELRSLIADKFEAATVDQLDRFAAAADALDSVHDPHHADRDAEATTKRQKNEAKAELVQSVSAYESLLKHIGLRESCHDLVELVQLTLRSDAMMSGVMPRIRRLLVDPQQTPPLDWLRVLSQDCEKHTAKLRELTHLATLTTTTSHHLAIVTRIEAFVQLVGQTIKQLQEQALAQYTSELEAVTTWVSEQRAPGRADAQPKADLQSAYHQLARLRDCSAKLQLYGLSPSNSDDLHGQVQQLTRQHFLAYLTVLDAKAMDAPTRHAIERLSRDRLKNRHDRYTINCTLSCQKEVDDLRERMQAMIDQRMRKSRVGTVPNRAEEMLQQPELFDLSDFAKLYHEISRLLDYKKQPLDEATTANLMWLQERLNAWTLVAYDTALTADILSAENYSSDQAALLFHPSGLPDIETAVMKITYWYRAGRNRMSNAMTVDEQIERLGDLRTKLEEYCHEDNYLRLADTMHDLERKLCGWVESEPDTINDILDIFDDDDEDANPDDGDDDGMSADNDEDEGDDATESDDDHDDHDDGEAL